MLALGWGPYQNDHEDANGQFEMNWTYSDALTTADRHAFFKYMVKTLAEAHGLRATFMPKPFANLSGNGCHVHVSLWDAESEREPVSRSQPASSGCRARRTSSWRGVLHHAEALCALTNPTVNSFKRINGAPTQSGATWSPNTISYTRQQPHAHDPHPGRRSLRAPAGRRRRQSVSAAGRGDRRGPRWARAAARPRRRAATTTCTRTRCRAAEVRRLPSNLLDALRALRANEALAKTLGSSFVDAYTKLKEHEWHEHHAQISAWERQVTLDC